MGEPTPDIVRPLPVPTQEDAPFWAAAREHRLILPHCLDCGHLWLPAYARCTRCASANLDWIKASGRGTVWAAIEMHRQYVAWFAPRLPYAVVVIRLEEGPFLYSNIVGADYSEIAIDAPVEVIFEDASETISLPLFRLAEAPNATAGSATDHPKATSMESRP